MNVSLEVLETAAKVVCVDCDARRCPGYKVCPEVTSFAQLVELEEINNVRLIDPKEYY